MQRSSMRQVFGIDLRTLAFFRICLACLLLGDLADRAIDLSAHYTDSGVMPRAMLLDLGGWRPSLHLMSGSVVIQGLLFVLSALFFCALLFGYRTRFTTAVCWVLVLSLQERNPYLVQGGDILIRLLLFWSIFLPLGARFSIDAALNRQKSENQYFSIATIALLFQCMYVYFFGALLKTGDTWLGDGTALMYVLHVDSYATPIGQWFLAFPSLMQTLTYVIWYVELLAPFLMFLPFLHLPFRIIALLSLIVLHLGIFIFMKVGIFPFASLASLMVFIPGAFWDRLNEHYKARGKVRIYYDEPCDFCLKMCLLLRTFLLLNSAKIVPAQSDAEIGPILDREYSWVVVDSDGTQYLRWDAMILLVRRSPLFAPLAAIMRLGIPYRLGTQSYNWVATNRELLGRFSQRFLPYNSATYQLSAATATLVGLLFVCVLYSNIVRSPALPYQWPEFVRPLTDTLALRQNWSMFAPDAPQSDQWFVAIGELVNGERVDLIQNAPDPGYQKPAWISNFFASNRWKLYYWRAFNHEPEIAAHMLARYLCNRWDANEPSHRSVYKIELGYVVRPISLAGAAIPDQRSLLIYNECGKLRQNLRLMTAAPVSEQVDHMRDNDR